MNVVVNVIVVKYYDNVNVVKYYDNVNIFAD